MRIYRSVCTYIWNDDKFPFVSDDCQLVWFHIFTNPLSSPLGVFRASLAGLAEDKNRNGLWPTDRYRRAIDEAVKNDFLRVDEKALLVSFPKYFSEKYKCNHPQSPNVIVSWADRYNDLPSSHLKTECFQSLKALTEGLGEAFREAFRKAFEKASPNTDTLYLIPEPEPEKDILRTDFELFWKAYPRKKSKDKAFEAYKKAVKRKCPLIDDLVKIIDQLKRSKDWTKDNGEYIPYPASWLNAGGWNDESGGSVNWDKWKGKT